MGAKIVLSGHAREIRVQDDLVSFDIVAGPATRHPPQGLDLYAATRYRITCTAQQWERARQDSSVESAFFVEGYLEPRRDERTDELYVAVVATMLQSMLGRNRRRLTQLREALDSAREAFRQAHEAGVPKQELEGRAAAFVTANERVARFVERHPELAERRQD